MRVYQIAKMAGVTSRDVREYLDFLGMPVKTASAKITGEVFIETLVARLVATRDDFARPYLKAPF